MSLGNGRDVYPVPQSQLSMPSKRSPCTVSCRERDGDMQVMLKGLKSGAYTALVLDAPVLDYVAGTNEACDLFLVGDVFESFSLALAFPAAFSDATVFAFSQSIVKLQVCC